MHKKYIIEMQQKLFPFVECLKYYICLAFVLAEMHNVRICGYIAFAENCDDDIHKD